LHQKINGAPEGNRTPGTRIRSPLLYPTELQAHSLYFNQYIKIYVEIKKSKSNLDNGAEDEIRTRDFHLGKVTLYH
jgi:hypothetical protein